MDKPSLTVESTRRLLQSPSDDATASDPVRQGSVHRLVIFRLENQRYALHLTTVERVLRMIAVSPVTEVFGVHEVASEIVSSHAAQLVSSSLSNEWKPSTCARPR